jgi:hypothetical protein
VIKSAGLLFALLLAFAAPALAQEGKRVFMGGQDIVLPQMAGMKEVYGVNEQFDGLVRQFVPPENRLLAVYLTEEDAAGMQSGAAGLKRYILVQTTKNDITFDSEKDFDIIRDEIAKGAGTTTTGSDAAVQKHLDEASGYINDTFHRRTKLQIGETRGLGAFMNYEGAFGVAMIANVGVAGPEGREEDLGIVTSVSAMNTKGKMLFVNAYSHYNGDADADFVRDTAKDYAKALFAANGMGELKEASRPVPEIAKPGAAGQEAGGESGFLNIALGAAGIICLGILVFFLLPLFRKISGGRKDESA